MVDAAIQAGVKRYMPSEFSTNTMSPVVRQLVPIFEVKKDLIDYLATKEEQGLSWTGISTGLLLDSGLSNGFLGFDIQSNRATIWDSGNQLFSATNVDVVGQAVVATLQHPEETSNKYLYIASFTTTQIEILAAFEAAAGKNWEVTHTSTDEEVKEGREMVARGDFSGFNPLVLASALGQLQDLRANFETEESLANELLGLPKEDLAITVKRVMDTK